MPDWHMDPDVNQAIIQFLDRTCMWERETGRRSTLVFIPEQPDEPILIAHDGKPLPPDRNTSSEEVEEIVKNALAVRRKESH